MRNQAADADAVAADEEQQHQAEEQQQAEAEAGDVLGEDPTSPMISMLQPKG